VNQKRFAVASALAATALPSLVMARGHIVDQVPELPLVVSNSWESTQKTKAAVALLKAVGAYGDYEKAKESHKLRAGKGKMRNRRHVNRRGPLIIFNEDNGITHAFRNLTGVDLAHVERLNLLQLAPGGHLGRFIIWTKGAFERLDALWGSVTRESTAKKGYTLPRPIMSNTDITRIINSDEVQSIVRPARTSVVRAQRKRNPLTNFGMKVKLNPYAMALRRSELLAQERNAARKAQVIEEARKSVPTTVSKDAEKRKAARKAHAQQQEHNYQRIVNDDFKKPKLGKPKAGAEAATTH
jgi:large subunit ribosomal protein L4e